MARAPRADAVRNRDRLLEVASAAVSRDGVEASLEGIARDAGVGIGTLYRHFPSRDALLEAVYRHNVDQLLADADDLLETKPPVEALAEFMQRFVAYVATKRGLAGHLKTVVSADSDLFESSKARLGTAVARLVDAAVASGGVRADADPDDLIRALAAVCMASEGTHSLDQQRRIAQLLMDGLRFGASQRASA